MRQPLPAIHSLSGCWCRVGADPGERLVQAGRPDQAASDHRHARERRMNVRVLESGQQGPAAQVHHLGPAADQVGDAVVGGVADGDDPVAAHGHRAGPVGPDPAGTSAAARGISGVDGPAGEDHVRLLAHPHLLIFATTACPPGRRGQLRRSRNRRPT